MRINRSALIIILVGIFFLLSNLGLLPHLGEKLSKWWPLLLIAFGILMLFRRRR